MTWGVWMGGWVGGWVGGGWVRYLEESGKEEGFAQDAQIGTEEEGHSGGFEGKVGGDEEEESPGGVSAAVRGAAGPGGVGGSVRWVGGWVGGWVG